MPRARSCIVAQQYHGWRALLSTAFISGYQRYK
uniref:Uncharacterized protein n=1 Tax=Anguilla anguilla TaxID=7936 RepID=A0A0E9RP86_ANGAN